MNRPINLDALFAPRSIAVVGASADTGKTGSVPINLLLRNGYTGDIYPVNPRVEVIQGLPCFSALADIPGHIDLVIIAVPAARAYGALEQARPGQVSSAVIFSSGFAETGAEGQQAQAELIALAQARQIRLLGPNCLGFINMRADVYATFSPAPLNGTVSPGRIGMVTQSGAFGAYAYCMARERGLGLSFWISTGNESDIDVADCINWLVDDPYTGVIMAYMEGCQDGEKLKHALTSARAAGKPVVITKIGRTASGAKAAASHTAALAGDDAVYDTLFRQYGAIRAHTIDEFFNVGYALSVWTSVPVLRQLGIVSISGGVGALMADEADEQGLTLPPMPEEARQRLLERIPFASANNPVDITGQAITEPTVLIDTACDMLESGQYGALTIFLAAAGSSETLWPHIVELARILHERYGHVPLILCALLPDERRHILEQYGCVTFSDPSSAVRTVAAILQRGATAQSISTETSPRTLTLPPGAQTLSEAESMSVLSQGGVPVIPFDIARSPDEAVAFAGKLGGPVVMKIVSADILHKSDAGGVKLGLGDADAVRCAYDDILSSVSKKFPEADIDGVLVAPMVDGGIECIMGMHRDPVFGPVIMFGLGGIYVEILKDISFRLAPFDKAEALNMISETRAAQLLKGARGRPTADVNALAEGLASLSQLAYAARGRISSIDVNPFLVLPAGQGALALDALVQLDT